MSIEVMKRIKSLLQDTKMIDSHTISAVVAECDMVILAQQPATGEPVLTVEREPDYWSGGHFHKGDKPHINPMKVWSLPIGTKLYTHPAPSVPTTPEPLGWLFQHEETGLTQVVDCQQVEWGFEANNPRWQKIRQVCTHPAPSEPSLIERAISSGHFGVLPMKATIPMCKAGWGASGGELTFQQIGHIYEEMYKARPLLDDSSTG